MSSVWKNRGEEALASSWHRWRYNLRHTYDIVHFGLRKLYQDHATEMAAALTYRTIFSLIPTIVLALVLFRAFGGLTQFNEQAQNKAFDYLGLSTLAVPEASHHSRTQPGESLVLTPGSTPAPPSARSAPPSDPDSAAIRHSLAQIVSHLADKASQLDFTKIGGVGVLVLIWAALALVITVEQAFNRIYQCPVGRPWHLRIAVYWAVVTLGPLLLWVSLYVTERFMLMVGQPGAFHGTLRFLGHLTSILATWFLLFLTYVLMPNTRVLVRPAIIGSLVSSVLWELSKWGFRLYVTTALPYAAIYGALALIPLFLVWVYLTWLVVLFGLEVTFVLQLLASGQFNKQSWSPEVGTFCDSASLVPLMVVIAREFTQGHRASLETLSRQLRASIGTVLAMTTKLEQVGLILRTTDRKRGQQGYTLAMPPDHIPLDRLLELGR